MDESPVAFSSSLPLWAKVVVGAVLAAIALYSVRRAVRRTSELPRWVDPRTYDRRGVLLPAIVAAVLVLALIALGLDVEHNRLISRTFDTPVHDWFVDRRVSWLTPVVITITNLVSPFGTTVLAIVVATLLAFRTRSWVPALIVFIGPSAAGLLVRLVKFLAPRTRPPEIDQLVITTEASFPSGHVAGAASLYGCIAVVVLIGFFGPVSRRTAILTVGLAVLLALVVIWTRLYLGVHWFTDVSASVLLAGIVVTLTLAGYRQFVRTRPPVG